MAFVQDTFTAADGTLLSAHTADVGGSWAGDGFDLLEIQSNRLAGNGKATIGTPATAEYDVQAVLHYFDGNPGVQEYICGRMSDPTGALTAYVVRYLPGSTNWELGKWVSNSFTSLGTWAEALSAGDERTIKLEIRDAAKKVYVDGVERISSADNTITATGQPGVYFAGSHPAAQTRHYDNFTATDASSTPATSYTLTAPTPNSGETGVASGNFTVQPDGTYTGTITPSDGGGGGTFTPASLSFTAESGAKTFTYTPAADGVHTISTTDTPGGGSSNLTDPASVTYTSSSPVVVTVDDANWFFSPYNWFKSGSSYALTNCSGAYFKTKFTGTSAILTVDVAALVAAGAASNRYPFLKWSVDGGAYQTLLLTSASEDITLATGLAPATHTLELHVVALSAGLDIWTTPVAALKIVSLTLDGGAALSAPDLRANRMLVYGDSITEAVPNNDITSYDAHDATGTWALPVAQAFDCEYGIVAVSGHGIIADGFSNWPKLYDDASPAADSWDMYFSGQSRLSAGLLSPAPDYVLLNEGTNDRLTAEATIQAAWEAFLPNLRTAAGASAEIFVLVPFGRFAACLSAIPAAVTTVADSKIHSVDLGAAASAGLTITGGATQNSLDGIHPDAYTSARLSGMVVQAMQEALTPTVEAVAQAVWEWADRTLTG